MKTLNNYIQESIFSDTNIQDKVDDVIANDFYDKLIKSKQSISLTYPVNGRLNSYFIEDVDPDIIRRLFKFDKNYNIIIDGGIIDTPNGIILLYLNGNRYDFKDMFKDNKISKINNCSICFRQFDNLDLRDYFSKDCTVVNNKHKDVAIELLHDSCVDLVGLPQKGDTYNINIYLSTFSSFKGLPKKINKLDTVFIANAINSYKLLDIKYLKQIDKELIIKHASLDIIDILFPGMDLVKKYNANKYKIDPYSMISLIKKSIKDTIKDNLLKNNIKIGLSKYVNVSVLLDKYISDIKNTPIYRISIIPQI